MAINSQQWQDLFVYMESLTCYDGAGANSRTGLTTTAIIFGPDKSLQGLGEKLFDEAGRILGFKITRVHPVEGTTMEISIASEIIGTRRVLNGNNVGSGAITQSHHEMVEGSYQYAFTTADRDQFLWWAHE